MFCNLLKILISVHQKVMFNELFISIDCRELKKRLIENRAVFVIVFFENCSLVCSCLVDFFLKFAPEVIKVAHRMGSRQLNSWEAAHLMSLDPTKLGNLVSLP